MPFKSLTPQPPEVNKFTLTVGTSGNTTYILDRSYAAGVYTVTFQGGDNTFDIYAIGADGTNVGYTNSGTLTATDKIKEIVVLGAANNEEIIFDNVQAGDVITPTSKGDVASAGAFVTSVDPSSLPSVDDTVTVTGGNFAADVEAYFIDQSANEVAAKTVVRNSSTEIVVTRPDSFSTADSPFTIKVVNPNVTLPTGSSAHLLSNAVTAGTNPVWQTTAAQVYNIGIANTITLVASDTEASDVDYAITAGSLPAGLTLDGETGVISGTPSGGAEGDQTVFTVRATDAGGNFVDREFTFTANGAPTWTTPAGSLGDSATTIPYTLQLVANGGSAGGVLSYSLQSGALPNGLSLSSTGLISGTNNDTAGTTDTFTVRVADENGLFADREFSLNNVLAELYAFSSHTFTSAGNTGRSGPSLSAARAAYSTTWDEQYLNMSTQGIQEWTVPQTGTYRITAAGAQGGPNRYSGIGGRGATLRGDFSLSVGEIIKIAVGQAGPSATSGSDSGGQGSGGGGGGTFVADSSNSPLIVAGGGGGSADDGNSNGDGIDASYSTSGTESAGGFTGSAGSGGGGGFFPGGSWSGGSGAGFNGDGSQPRHSNNFVGSSPLAFVNGATGGLNGNQYGAEGGFGGGGAGSWAGAGGGGYSGGAGDLSNGDGSDKEGGGGGGSFNSGANASNLAYNQGNGYVTIELL